MVIKLDKLRYLATLAARGRRAPRPPLLAREQEGVGNIALSLSLFSPSVSSAAPTGLRRPTFSNQLLSDQEGSLNRSLCLPTKPTPKRGRSSAEK